MRLSRAFADLFGKYWRQPRPAPDEPRREEGETAEQRLRRIARLPR